MKSLFALIVFALVCVGCDRDAANRGTDGNRNRNTPVNSGGDGSGTPNQGQTPR